jgi:uncharacterized protein involved in exopolysaccharide biosynthesis
MDSAKRGDRLPHEHLSPSGGRGGSYRDSVILAGDTLPASGWTHPWSLRDLYRAVFRFWKRGLTFFLAVMLIVVAALVVCPRKYASEAWLFVRLGRESVTLDPTVTTGSVVSLNVTRESEINSIIHVMSSRQIAEKVVEKVRLDPPPKDEAEREQGIDRLMKNIKIWSPRQTNVIGVSYRSRTAQRSHEVVSALVETYLEEHLRLNSTPGSHQFFRQQADLLKQELDEASAALRDAKNRFHLASVEGRREALQREISTVESRILETEAGLAASDAKIQVLRSALKDLPEAFVRAFALADRSAAAMREELYALQTREQELLAKYTEDHPAVVAVRKQVREAERILKDEQPDRLQATAAAVLTEQTIYESLRARAETLDGQLTRLRGQLHQLNGQEVEIGELERRVEMAEKNYLTYVSSLEQTRVDQAIKSQQISNINIVQPATLVHKPVSPKPVLTLALALLVATCGGLGVIMLSEYLDQSLRAPEDIETRLGLPLLVSIPTFPWRESTYAGVV